MSDLWFSNLVLRLSWLYLSLSLSLVSICLCLVLSCLVLSCLVLSCLVLSCLALPCLVLSCLVSNIFLFRVEFLICSTFQAPFTSVVHFRKHFCAIRFVLSCPVLSWLVLSCLVLSYLVLSCLVFVSSRLVNLHPFPSPDLATPANLLFPLRSPRRSSILGGNRPGYVNQEKALDEDRHLG